MKPTAIAPAKSKQGHIAGVEYLTVAPDENLIEQARWHFERRNKDEQFDGFEIWDAARHVYSWPEEPKASDSG